MKNKSLTIKILSAITFALVALGAMSLASYFTSSLFMGAIQNTTGTMQNVSSSAYLVSVAKSQSALEAEALSKDISCSGYIWKEDEYFHVIHSACEQENDAARVVSLLQKNGQAAEIVKLAFQPISIDAPFSAEQHTLATEAAASFMQTFKGVNDIAVGLETGVYSKDAAAQKLDKIKQRLSKLQVNFAESFKEFESEKVTALGEYLADELESISLCSAKPEDVKYKAVEILEIYRNMTAELK